MNTLKILILSVIFLANAFGLDLEEIKNGSKLCESRATCFKGKRNRLDISLDWRDVNCFCDDLCLQYGDCCPTADSFDPQQMKINRHEYECVHVTEYTSYYMRTVCKDGWDDVELENMCLQGSAIKDRSSLDPFLHTPVTSNLTEVTYRNFYCAICNGESLRNIDPWNAMVSCPNSNPGTTLTQENLRYLNGSWEYYDPETQKSFWCEIYPSIKDTLQHKLRNCKSVIATCHSDWSDEDTADLCSSYTTIVFGPLEPRNSSFGGYYISNTYKNVHCAICNHVNITDLDCYERDFRQSPAFVPSMSFTTLFNFGNVNSVCEEGFVWDPFFKKCRNVVCFKDNHIYKDGICVRDHNSLPTVEPSNSTKENSSSFSPCEKMSFSRNEYKRGKNNSVVIFQYRRTYTDSQYEINEDGTLFVCMTSNYSRVMGWLSLIGIGLSCVCIIIHLFTFVIVPDLRNLSGKNLASMCLSLLLGYFCFLITAFKESDTSDCKIVGSFMYYGFMASFTWMNVMAYDIWRTLQLATSQLRLTAGKQWRKYIYYSIYTWFFPALMLFVIWIFDLLQPSFIPRYYLPELGQHQCWFGQKRGILIYFALPLSIIMLFNVLFFIMAVRYVAMTTASTNHFTNIHSHKVQLKLYARLALLMGISWISGIIAGYWQNEYVWYVFIFLSAFQGVYILLAFTCTKKVFKSLRLVFSEPRPSFRKDRQKLSVARGFDSNDSTNSNMSNTSNLTITSSFNSSIKKQ